MRRGLEDELVVVPIDTPAALILRMPDLPADPCSMGFFSVELSIRRSTATSAIVRLERRGWARRYRGAPDGRVVIAQLTSEGRVAAKAAREAIDALEVNIEQAAGSDLLIEFNRVA